MPLELVSLSTCTALSPQRAGGADRIGEERGWVTWFRREMGNSKR